MSLLLKGIYKRDIAVVFIDATNTSFIGKTLLIYYRPCSPFQRGWFLSHRSIHPSGEKQHPSEHRTLPHRLDDIASPILSMSLLSLLANRLEAGVCSPGEARYNSTAIMSPSSPPRRGASLRWGYILHWPSTLSTKARSDQTKYVSATPKSTDRTFFLVLALLRS